MENISINKLKGVLIVPIGIAIILVPLSLLIGWNLVTLIVFWLVITPALTIYLPKLVSKNINHLFESLVGMGIFYALMVLMIYDHYQSDYFQLMMWSGVINLISVTVHLRWPTVQAE